MMKTCNRCKEEKLLTSFYRMSASPDGRQYTCKGCKKEIARSTESKAYQEEYRKKEGFAERASEYNKKWYRKGGSQTVLKNVRLRQAKRKKAEVLYSELDDLLYAEMIQHCKDLERLTGEAHHIDHIVPLAHKDACGLHTAANWQVVPAKWNLKKNNRSMAVYDEV